jgi:hypothetical protein
LYQLINIYATSSASATGASITTYSNTATDCLRKTTGCSSSLDAFQLVDQTLANNINDQLTGTISECASDVTLPKASPVAGVSMMTRQATGVTPAPAQVGQYYFLKLEQSSAVGIVVDSASKVICKMSFTFGVLDSTTVPITQQLTPGSTYDASYGYLVQDIPAALLTPDTYLIIGTGGQANNQVQQALQMAVKYPAALKH